MYMLDMLGQTLCYLSFKFVWRSDFLGKYLNFILLFSHLSSCLNRAPVKKIITMSIEEKINLNVTEYNDNSTSEPIPVVII